MRSVFVDTVYWVALINPRDQWHLPVLEAQKTLGNMQRVTTEAVLIETANYYATLGSQWRQTVSRLVANILTDPYTQVAAESPDLLTAGLALYEARLDKQYSLTDCISMLVMRRYGLTDILTHDRHFAQEGFNVLI